jgi:cobalt-zinc-cadmium efflux system membrane fusion protein
MVPSSSLIAAPGQAAQSAPKNKYDGQDVIKNVVQPDRDPNRLWCNEHNVYEDECVICHPELASKTKGDSPGDLQCEEHGVPEEECGICQPELIDTLQPGQGLKIRLESPESAVKAGVGTSIPTTGSSLAGFVVLSRVSYDLNRLARITPLTAGVVQRVLADVGDAVSKGQVLLEIVSPEIAGAKSDYLSALANEALKELVFKREKGLVGKKVSSQQEYEQALAEYRMAGNTAAMTRQQLLNYGLTEEQIREAAETRSSSSLLPILAPFSGTLRS